MEKDKTQQILLISCTTWASASKSKKNNNIQRKSM